MRDTRKDSDYFETLLIDFEVALNETQAALDNGNFTSPSERVDICQRLYQLAIMRAVSHYSYGAHLGDVRRYVLEILPYRKQLKDYCDKLPAPHQFYRNAFEKLGGQSDAVGSANINRYIYTLWWLSLLQACEADQAHIDDALAIIGEQGKDTLLDNIAIALGDTDRAVSPLLYYPEVYKTLNDTFTAEPEQQSALLNQFIEQWYAQLEDADWHENHECDCEFEYTDYYIGYWCFELSLVANILNINKDKLTPHTMLPIDLIKQ
ncbi:hypothetical protein GCM10009111_34840 [Colwellia asteriadis]|uniref:PoNi C-terminal domain-containing protein n=1 Tax=Colwellia asteriadis TaxID=517723 RepID=A0ABP3WNV7_9GAMM